MSKLLKILFAIESVLVVIIIVLYSIDNQQTSTGYVIKEINEIEKNGNTEFKVFTKAVCEEKSEHVFCSDKLFVKCNNKEYVVNEDNLDNFTECNLKLNLSDIKVKGQGVFKRG